MLAMAKQEHVEENGITLCMLLDVGCIILLKYERRIGSPKH